MTLSSNTLKTVIIITTITIIMCRLQVSFGMSYLNIRGYHRLQDNQEGPSLLCVTVAGLPWGSV